MPKRSTAASAQASTGTGAGAGAGTGTTTTAKKRAVLQDLDLASLTEAQLVKLQGDVEVALANARGEGVKPLRKILADLEKKLRPKLENCTIFGLDDAEEKQRQVESAIERAKAALAGKPDQRSKMVPYRHETSFYAEFLSVPVRVNDEVKTIVAAVTDKEDFGSSSALLFDNGANLHTYLDSEAQALFGTLPREKLDDTKVGGLRSWDDELYSESLDRIEGWKLILIAYLGGA